MKTSDAVKIARINDKTYQVHHTYRMFWGVVLAFLLTFTLALVTEEIVTADSDEREYETCMTYAQAEVQDAEEC